MLFEISSYFDCDISKNPVGPPCIIFSHKSTKPGTTCLGIISLPMRRVHDDVGRGSVEEESVSDHPRSTGGGGGGRRSALSEEMFRYR